MSTESAIGRAADSLEAVAKAIHTHNSRPPVLSRKQLIFDAAIRIASAKLSQSSFDISYSIDNGLGLDAVRLANQIYDRVEKGEAF